MSRWLTYTWPLIAATAIQAPVHAQASPDQAAPAAAPTEGRGLQEIVVTAQRRAENLQRAAVSVSAVGGQALTQAGITDVQQLSRVVPSLIIQPGGGGANVYLRGVGNQQTNAFGENAIAFNFDGVYLARPTAPFGMLYDLERVEVVKGPQGTLYGRNATGGAVNIIPKKPRLGTLEGELNAEYGNYNAFRTSGGINVPVGDQLAIRIAGQVTHRKGYLSDGYDDEVGQAARVSVLAQFAPGWTGQLVADYFHQGGKGQGGVLAPSSYVPQAPALSQRIGGSDPLSVAALLAFGDAHPPFSTFLRNGFVNVPAGDGYLNNYFYGVTGILDGDLGPATLTIQPAFRHSRPDYLFYFTGFRGQMHEVDNQESVEARLSSNGGGPLRYVLGAYYFHEHQDAQDFFNQGLLATTRFNPRLSTDSKAVFGQLTYAISPALRAVGGLRYTNEHRSLVTSLAAGTPTNVNPPLGAPFFGKQSVSKVTWKAGVEFDAAPQSLIYANVATGFKSGGFFVGASPNNTFAPEQLTAYTIGTKNRFFDNRVRLNLEGFYWKYRNQQTSFVGGIDVGTGLTGVGGKTVNAGQSRIYGFELEGEWQVTPHDNLGIDLQYLNARYRSFTYTALSASGAPLRSGCTVTGNRLANPGTTDTGRLFDLDCSGKDVLNSPRWSTQLRYEHRFDVGAMRLSPGVRSRIEASRETTIDFLPESQQGAYTMTDLYVTLTGPEQRWSLTGFVNNVEDATVLAGGFVKAVVQTYYATLRPPRTYGIRASYRF
jgi:iron complex outermembrane receptor protein